MDSIRFEPKVSAIIAIDRNPAGSGGDLFADMLGEQLKKRAEADRPELGIRRRPNGDRRIGSEDHPTPGRRPHLAVKHAHEFNDTATTARDVTPNRDVQPTLPAPAQDRPANANGQAAPVDTTDESPAAAADDKDQQTDGLDAAPVSVLPAADADAEETSAEEVVTMAADIVDPEVQDQTPSTEVPVDEAAIAHAVPDTEDPSIPQSEPDLAEADDAAAQQAQEQEQEQAEVVALAANLSAALDVAMAGLLGGEARQVTDTQPLAGAGLPTLTVAKAPKPGAAEAAAAGAAELAAKITPEAPQPAAEARARAAQRATPAAEIKAAIAASHAPQPTAAPPALPSAAPAPALGLGQLSPDGFDPALLGEDPAAPGWTLHLAQGAAAKRPDFVAQLRQHLQELPAHEQVAVNIRRAVRDGADRLSIQLSPAELGRIHVKLEMDEEKRATASITVEKPSTLELLQRDVKALERALQDAGLKMDGNDLSFSLAQQDGEAFAQDLKQAGPNGYGGGSDEAEPEVDAAIAAAQVDTAAGLVNVQV